MTSDPYVLVFTVDRWNYSSIGDSVLKDMGKIGQCLNRTNHEYVYNTE